MQNGDDVIRWLISAVMVAILILVVINAFEDHDEMAHHHVFFDEVREFIGRGGRNNEQQGFCLCLRTSALEKAANKKDVDCEKLYPGADPNGCD